VPDIQQDRGEGYVRYTGHERDGVNGIDYMFKRYYSQHLARFLSTDPMGGKIGSSQSWNRYLYIQNSPINGIDPDGCKIDWQVDDMIKPSPGWVNPAPTLASTAADWAALTCMVAIPGVPLAVAQPRVAGAMLSNGLMGAAINYWDVAGTDTSGMDALNHIMKGFYINALFTPVSFSKKPGMAWKIAQRTGASGALI